MKNHIINSTEDLILLIEKEKSYKLEAIQEVFNFFFESNVKLNSKTEILFMLKWYLKDNEKKNVLEYRVCPN